MRNISTLVEIHEFFNYGYLEKPKKCSSSKISSTFSVKQRQIRHKKNSQQKNSRKINRKK